MLRAVCICYIVVLSAILILDVCMCSKYSKDANLKTNADRDIIDFRDQETPFRMQKTNLLWSKGRKVLPGTKLADLYADLKVHDKHEAHFKKMRAQDMDKDGAMEAKVLKNYRRIVDYYGLDILSQKDLYMSNEIPLEDDINFHDSKLQTLWKKAEETGFSEKDLNMLKEEFWHQQMKIDEYDYLHREMDNIADPDRNTVEPEQGKQNLSPKESLEKKASLKKNKIDIKEGYIKLEHLISSMPTSEQAFQDSRVQKLWALAKKTNWTEEQLSGFKEELKHFEHRLKKQSYYQQQLELSEETLKELEDGQDIPDKHKHLEEKHKHIALRVKKLHLNLKSRIDDALQHTEL